MEADFYGTEKEFSDYEEHVPVSLKLDLDDVERFYTTEQAVDPIDIVIHVRRKYPLPHTPIILELEEPMSSPSSLFMGNNIFIKGSTDSKINDMNGLSMQVIMPFAVDENTTEDDLLGAYNNFLAMYSLGTARVHTYGDPKHLAELHKKTINNAEFFSIPLFYPDSIIEHIQVEDDCIRINEFVSRLDIRNYITYPTVNDFRQVVDEVEKKVDADHDRLIYVGTSAKSAEVKWLIATVCAEKNIMSAYMSQYVIDIVDLHIMYPMDMLSFSERFTFVRTLPKLMGYVSKVPGVYYQFLYDKCYCPKPVVIFNTKRRKLVSDEQADEFLLDFIGMPGHNYEMFGWKSLFKEFPTNDPVSDVEAMRDLDSNVRKLFDSMVKVYGKGDIFPSIKNTALVRKDGEFYLLYFNDQFTITGSLNSEYFGNEPYAIPEVDFYRLVDSRYIAVTENLNNSRGDNARVTALTTLGDSKSILEPPIPVFDQMCATLLKSKHARHSHYDYYLRVAPSVLPTLSFSSSVSDKRAKLFEKISLENLYKDEVARHYISAFGSLHSGESAIPVSIHTFAGMKLLSDFEESE